MLRFVAATLITFAVLVTVNSAVTSADPPGLDVTIEYAAVPGELTVNGEVANGSPLSVDLTGVINETVQVFNGNYETFKSVPPGTQGWVTVTAQYNGETATDKVWVDMDDDFF